jgi:predicted Fe-Mo cluster-binding NifX family protein
MTIAVTERQGRIAPVFEWCRRVLVVEQSGGKEILLREEDWSDAPSDKRARLLQELQVELLVCGGISRCVEEEIRGLGIGVISWVAGDVWEVLRAMRCGLLDQPRYAAPGGRMCERKRRRNKGGNTGAGCKLQ